MHMHSLRGSPYWLAPEAIRGVGAGRKADVWALGGVLLETSPATPRPVGQQVSLPRGTACTLTLTLTPALTLALALTLTLTLTLTRCRHPR